MKEYKFLEPNTAKEAENEANKFTDMGWCIHTLIEHPVFKYKYLLVLEREKLYKLRPILDNLNKKKSSSYFRMLDKIIARFKKAVACVMNE